MARWEPQPAGQAEPSAPPAAPAPEPDEVAPQAPREVAISNPAAYVYVDSVDPARPKKAGWWSKK